MMKKSNWGITIFVIIFFVSILTNPSLDEHKQAVKFIINQKVQSSLSVGTENNMENLGVLLGSSLAGNLIDNSVTRDNYLLFSITKISWEGNSKAIGYGLFGNVFLSEKVNDAFNDRTYNSIEEYDDIEITTPVIETIPD